MTSWLWLGGAVVAAVGSYVAGWPAWNAARERGTRDMNAERYLAWRGRADRSPSTTGMNQRDRQRLVVAGLLGLVALFCLVGFFTYA